MPQPHDTGRSYMLAAGLAIGVREDLDRPRDTSPRILSDLGENAHRTTQKAAEESREAREERMIDRHDAGRHDQRLFVLACPECANADCEACGWPQGSHDEAAQRACRDRITEGRRPYPCDDCERAYGPGRPCRCQQ